MPSFETASRADYPVPAVAAVVAFRIMLLVAQALGHLALHSPFDHPLCELLQKLVYVFRLSSLLEPLVNELVTYRPWSLLLFIPFS